MCIFDIQMMDILKFYETVFSTVFVICSSFKFLIHLASKHLSKHISVSVQMTIEGSNNT